MTETTETSTFTNSVFNSEQLLKSNTLNQEAGASTQVTRICKYSTNPVHATLTATTT